MRNLIVITLFTFVCTNLSHATVQQDIEAAIKAGKSVFLVITEEGNADNTAAIALGKKALKLNAKLAVIELNRSDKANAGMIKKYGLAGTPLPLFIVLAYNGAVAGAVGFKEASSENLIALIPSPQKAIVLKAMDDHMSVFIVVSKKSMPKKDVLSGCETACTTMKNKAKIVEIDFDNVAEKKFLNELNNSEIGNEPKIYVVNAEGQLAGSFAGVTNAKTLVATANKKTACCAPGSGKSCAPAKK